MPIVRKWAYFDHAAVAPLPEPTRVAITAWLDEAACDGDTVWPRWSRAVERARTLAAQLLGADPEEVALVRSTTEGINLVAEGFPWRPGDNVVTLDNEFPSNQYPWLNLASRGVETRRVPTDNGRVDLQRIEDACDSRTQIISVSWVGYSSGWRLDLGEISSLARRCGALLFVDAIQGLGVFPLNVQKTPIDFLAADGHKWLLGPEGAGVFYLKREHLERLRPLGVGWHSVVHASDFSKIMLDLRPTAARYEGGTQNMAGFIGLAASLELLLGLGISAISEHLLNIADAACRQLIDVGCNVVSHRDGQHRSAIISFDWPGADPQAARQHCADRGIALGCRGGRMRISPHAYANQDDLDRLIEAIRCVPK